MAITQKQFIESKNQAINYFNQTGEWPTGYQLLRILAASDLNPPSETTLRKMLNENHEEWEKAAKAQKDYEVSKKRKNGLFSELSEQISKVSLLSFNVRNMELQTIYKTLESQGDQAKITDRIRFAKLAHEIYAHAQDMLCTKEQIRTAISAVGPDPNEILAIEEEINRQFNVLSKIDPRLEIAREAILIEVKNG